MSRTKHFHGQVQATPPFSVQLKYRHNFEGDTFLREDPPVGSFYVPAVEKNDLNSKSLLSFGGLSNLNFSVEHNYSLM